MNNIGRRIDSQGIPCFNIPLSEKKVLAELGDFTSTCCLLLVNLGEVVGGIF